MAPKPPRRAVRAKRTRAEVRATKQSAPPDVAAPAVDPPLRDGALFRIWLVSTGWSDVRAARELETTEASLSAWKHGVKVPGIADKRRIAKCSGGRVPASSWPLAGRSSELHRDFMDAWFGRSDPEPEPEEAPPQPANVISIEDAREKLEYDLYYAKNYTPFLDLLILLQTARVVIWPEGAR